MTNTICIASALHELNQLGVLACITKYPELQSKADVLSQIQIHESIRAMHLEHARAEEQTIEKLSEELRVDG